MTSQLELMQALLLVLADKQDVETNAVFIHGSPVRDDALDTAVIEVAAKIITRSGACAVLNGMSGEECRQANVAYAGWEAFEEELRSLCDTDLVHVVAGIHTAAECDSLIDLAQEFGWTSVTLVSQPHHILRCMLTMVARLKAKKSSLCVFSRAAGRVDWGAAVFKPILGGGTEKGTYFDMIESEFTRIEKYGYPARVDETGQAFDSDGKKFTQHATCAELIRYIQRRDAGALDSPATTPETESEAIAS